MLTRRILIILAASTVLLGTLFLPSNAGQFLGAGTITRLEQWTATYVSPGVIGIYPSRATYVGIGTTSPYAALSVVGQVVASYFTATSTTATSSFAYSTNLTSGCYAVNGVCEKDIQRMEYFGDGSDGDVTYTADQTLTRTMYYNNLTISNNSTTTPAGFIIFVKGTLTIDSGSVIDRSGGAGTKGSGSTGGGVGTACTTSASIELGAAAGAAGAGANGGTAAGGSASGVSVATYGGGIADAGGSGGDGTSGLGGSGGDIAGAQLKKERRLLANIFAHNTVSIVGGISGRGGGGGGGDGTAGGGGGGGGSAGCPIAIFAKNIVVNGKLTSDGGAGGNGAGAAAGNRGGGGGGAGGGGGVIYLVYETLTNNGIIRAAGGAKGDLGAGFGTGTNGSDGAVGESGFIIGFNLATASSSTAF
jgi:hypothetical protein